MLFLCALFTDYKKRTQSQKLSSPFAVRRLPSAVRRLPSAVNVMLNLSIIS